MSERQIARFAVVQVALVVIAFFGLGAFLKVQGYPGTDPSIRWSSLTLFLRQNGLLLIAAQTAIALFGLYARRRWRESENADAPLAIGLVISLILFILFGYAAVNPFTRTILLGGG